MPAPYTIACCQPRTQVVFEADGTFRPDRLERNIDHYCDLIRRAADSGAKLIVFPQFGLTGHRFVSIDRWIDASSRLPGPETRRLGEAAKAAGAYVVASITEVHDAFPGRYFGSAVVIGPDGDIAMTYRKNYIITARSRPIDVADQFIDRFGADSFLPVLDTPLGRIGIVIAGEVYWPETIRSLALKGAEIIINPSGAGPQYFNVFRPTSMLVRPVRAFENLVYLAFCNVGVIVDGDSPLDPGAPDGAWTKSEIYDFNGLAIGNGSNGADRFATAEIDIEALRRARVKPGANFIAQMQPPIHADLYGQTELWPANEFAERPLQSHTELLEIEARVWRSLAESGRVVLPDPE